jgi:hypothetical protein
MKRPKMPKPTAQELAVERRTMLSLDKEIEESEKRLKAAARGKIGAASLLPTKPGAQPAGRAVGSMGRMLGRGGIGGSAASGRNRAYTMNQGRNK